MKKTDIRLMVFSIIFILAAIISLAVSQFTSERERSFTTSSKASESVPECKCDDQDICYPDGCTRKPKTPQNTYDDDRYTYVCEQNVPKWPPTVEYQRYYCAQHQPDCCADMVAHQDSRFCCFMERWHCHPNYCNLLTGDKRDCGKYWSIPSGWSEYGCVIKDSSGNKVPKYGLAPNIPGGNPTATPVPPTATFTPRPPTATPRPQQPTSTPRPEPTSTLRPNQPTPTPTTTRPGQPTSTPRPNQPTNPPGTQPTNPPIANNPNATWTPVPTWTPAPTWTTTPNNPNNPTPTSGSTFLPPWFPGNSGNEPQQADNIQPAPTSEPIEIKSPKELAREVVNPENIQKLDRATEKPLTVAKDSFDTVKKYDRKLESAVEGWVFKVRSWLQRLLQ